LSSCLGLFDERADRNWSEAELNVIRTSANLIGSALQRNDYEETIRLSERRNRIMLSALPDLLIRVDRSGMILDYSVNPNHPLYVHRDVISGRKLADTWPSDIAEKILGEEHDSGFTTHHLVESFKLPYSDDEYESRLYPISANEALIVIRDVTEQSMLNQMKSDFINRASHELRTPVTTAILLSELIQEGGEPEELDEYWRSLTSELRRQKILIDRLLLAGRLESGMMKLEHSSIDLMPILKDAAQAVKPIANKKKVTIHLDVPSEPVYIIGDKSALEQVFINLLNNATKFSPEGKSINIDFTESEDEVTVSLIDQGYGIPPEAISHLFERFYRAKNVTVAEIPGSGIGLYIVKSIVDELGGSIKVESELNQGTMFVVTLKKKE
jgi:signal transduction histidine kinase